MPLDAAALLPVRRAIDRMLASHEPYPAVAVDRSWTIVSANKPVRRILEEGVAPELLEPRPNAMRATLHPDGLASRILNLEEYAPHLLGNLAREAAVTPDHPVAALYEEVRAYPTVAGLPEHDPPDQNPAFIPMRLRALGGHELALLNTIATFGTARDLTVADLAIESFFPADDATSRVLESGFPG